MGLYRVVQGLGNTFPQVGFWRMGQGLVDILLSAALIAAVLAGIVFVLHE